MSKIHLCPVLWTLIFRITLLCTNTNSLYLRKFSPNNLNAITGKTIWKGEGSASPANLTSKCFFVKGGEGGREVRRVWRHRRACNESWIVLWLVPLVMLSPDRFSLSTSPLRSFRLFSQRWISLLARLASIRSYDISCLSATRDNGTVVTRTRREKRWRCEQRCEREDGVREREARVSPRCTNSR